MWSAIAAAGANLVGNILNYNAQKHANETNVALTREQMAFQREMSNTAVQRHANDLEKAGFNRLLAAGGEGASTPSGASAHVNAPQVTPMDIMAIEQSRANISKTKAETAVAGETAANLSEQNNNLKAQNALIKAETVLKVAEATGKSVDEVAFELFGFRYKSTTTRYNGNPVSVKPKDSSFLGDGSSWSGQVVKSVLAH